MTSLSTSKSCRLHDKITLSLDVAFFEKLDMSKTKQSLYHLPRDPATYICDDDHVEKPMNTVISEVNADYGTDLSMLHPQQSLFLATRALESCGRSTSPAW